MASVPTAVSPRNSLRAHHVMWLVLGLMTLSVLAFTEYSIFLGSDPLHARPRLMKELFVLVPHVAGGMTALVLGPFLFSNRFRQRHLQRHRIMGRVYVIAIAVASPLAVVLDPNIGNGMGGLLWAVCTFAAYQTARNRQIQAHRQWMVRSYMFTLNFVFTRVPNPIPAWLNLSGPTFYQVLLAFYSFYLLGPQIYFNWRELTTSRNSAS